jgi:hypothetical protein
MSTADSMHAAETVWCACWLPKMDKVPEAVVASPLTRAAGSVDFRTTVRR